MSYTDQQIQAVSKNAELFGYTKPVSRELAIKFLDFYFNNKSHDSVKQFWDSAN